MHAAAAAPQTADTGTQTSPPPSPRTVPPTRLTNAAPRHTEFRNTQQQTDCKWWQLEDSSYEQRLRSGHLKKQVQDLKVELKIAAAAQAEQQRKLKIAAAAEAEQQKKLWAAASKLDLLQEQIQRQQQQFSQQQEQTQQQQQQIGQQQQMIGKLQQQIAQQQQQISRYLHPPPPPAPCMQQQPPMRFKAPPALLQR